MKALARKCTGKAGWGGDRQRNGKSTRTCFSPLPFSKLPCSFSLKQLQRSPKRIEAFFSSLTFQHVSGPDLRDTARLPQRYPRIARYGVFGFSTWPIGCTTPSSFSERFPLGEHAQRRCETPPPPTKGVSQRYLRDTT